MQNVREIFEKMLEGLKARAEAAQYAYYNRLKDEALQFVGKFDKEWEEYCVQKYDGGQRLRARRFGNPDYQFQSRLLTTYIPKPKELKEGEVWHGEYLMNGDKLVWASSFQESAIIDGRFSHKLFAVDDINAKIDKIVADNIKAMFESFILKQTKKTEDIIKGRKATVTGSVHNFNLECYLKFMLEDGAKFDMQTQIVWKCNSYGTHYYAFPTTFHNAYKADGTKINVPSEAKLKANL
jgi:hypothetical protein